MAKRRIKVIAKRRAEVDVDKVVLALLRILEEDRARIAAAPPEGDAKSSSSESAT